MTPLLDRLVQLLFRLGATLRRARALHPRGTAFAGRLVLEGEGPLPTGERECVVRLSKAAGTPGRLPDALGVGIRVDVYGGPVDVLATTSLGTRGWRRVVPMVATSWGRARLSSMMPLASERGQRVQVLLRTDEPGLTSTDVRALAARLPVRFSVRVADRHRDLQRGELVVDGPEVPAVDLDPVTNAPQGWHLRPAWLAAARVSAYDGSRRGRPDSVEPPTTPADLPVATETGS